MSKKEYLDTLCEQIGNKHAKQLVVKEYEDHIEDQKEVYMADGIEESEAEQQAVRQMGNPIEAGTRLNQIHRPQFPKGLFIVVLMLTGIGIVMQSIGFAAQDNVYVNEHYLVNTICYNVIGLLIMGAILFFDYNYLVKYAYYIYAGYLIVYASVGILYLTEHYHNVFLVTGNAIGRMGSVNYFLLMLYPVILAAVIYRNKGRGMRGLLACAGLSLLPLFMQSFVWQTMFSAGSVEYVVVIYVVLLFAVSKKIFGEKRKGMLVLLILLGAAMLLLLCLLPIINPGNLLQEYQLARLRVVFSLLTDPQEYAATAGYVIVQLRKTMADLSLWGSHALPENIPTGDMYSTFIVTGIFAWFGIVMGCIVVGLLFFFCFRALYVSVKQKNRIGMLVGMTCSVIILLRSIVCMAINFGYGIYYTSSVPFLSYGKMAVIANAVYVGLILCVCRNGSVMPEKELRVGQRRRYLNIS